MWSAATVIAVGLSVLAIGQAPQAPPTDVAQAYYEFMLARHLENQGDDAGALEALKRALAADPTSAEIKAELAAFYARQNKATEAVAAAEAALAIDPRSAEAHRILGLVYSAWSDGNVKPPRGQTQAEARQKAIDHLSKILDTPAVATDLNLQVTLGRLHVRAGQPEKAIPILETVVSQAPFALEPYSLLADARLALGRVDDAIRALEMAAEIDPRRYAALGDLYERIGRRSEAADAYGRAVAATRIPSRDLKLRWSAALLNLRGGDHAARARDILKDVLAVSPQDPRALYLLSTAHERLGDFAAAEDAARRLLALDPTNAPALNLLGYMLAERGVKLPEAVDLIERALKTEPENPAYLDSLGWALFKQGKADQAEAPLRKAAAAMIDESVIQDHLGDVLAHRGKHDEAIAAWERALKGNREDIDRAAIEKKIKDARGRRK